MTTIMDIVLWCILISIVAAQEGNVTNVTPGDTDYPAYSLNILNPDYITDEQWKPGAPDVYTAWPKAMAQKLDENNTIRSRKFRRHDRPPGQHHHLKKGEKLSPSFDPNSPSNVVTQIDKHAFLPCIINDLGDQTVSWIRNRDAHILTVNKYTFISGGRFVPWFESETNTWSLQIKFIDEIDAGSYECQISTEPKISHFVNLTVIVPKVTIPEGRELYVRKGSDISLKCIIAEAIRSPPYVYWYHSNANLEKKVVHQAVVNSLSSNVSSATLVLKNATQKHAGNYTCAPSGISRSTSVMLHVLNGEHPAAMQTSGDVLTRKNLPKIIIMLCTCMSHFYRSCLLS